ncbi:ComEA family DNA-binding protein [Williamsia deligens]|uniref:ComEA family DNA-binding protein n=1 Tax=Williamsia deligens TaxID=321325 RepID=A0ABW3G151_9NOCA|nr:ComEA family DNA-binding protein [Williamsia deligens]MCP2195100.1 competence protein ComEA [Williamsia deligens]
MYHRTIRDRRPDVLDRLGPVAPRLAMPPGSSSVLPTSTLPADDDDPSDDWSWDPDPDGDDDAGDEGPLVEATGPPIPRWVDDVPGVRPRADDDPDPGRLRRPRRDRVITAPPAAIALVVVGLLACVVTVVTVVSGSSDEIPAAVAFPSSAGPVRPGADGGNTAAGTSASTSASVPPAASAPVEMVVSVVGLVRTPGLVRLPPTARIADAIARAGGGRPGADLLGLNMAAPLHDGDQVLVGYADPDGGPALRSAVVSGGAASGGAGGGPSGAADTRGSGRASTSAAAPAGARVDLNTADEAALDALPGVGPVTAAAIVEWRSRNGRFRSVDQLSEVNGIGPARLATLRELVTV